MNHLRGIQDTNSQLAYRTHTQMISRVCLGSEPGLPRFNKPWGFLNTKVMRHPRKIGLPSSLNLKTKKKTKKKQKKNKKNKKKTKKTKKNKKKTKNKKKNKNKKENKIERKYE